MRKKLYNFYSKVFIAEYGNEFYEIILLANQ